MPTLRVEIKQTPTRPNVILDVKRSSDDNYTGQSMKNQQVTIEEHEMPPDLARMFAQARRNLLWFSENAERLGVYQNCRGRYVAAAGGDLLTADTPQEVRSLA